MAKKALVFGSRGQLGIEISRGLQRDGWEVVSFDRHTADVRQADVVHGFIESASPELVVNCAAYNLVDRAEAEPAAAYYANALAVRNLATACRKCGARLLHFSSDYVFDGAKGEPYTEADSPHPRSAYGVSKLSGEHYAFAYLDTALVIRTCGVYGPEGIHTAHGNFVETMLRNAHAGRELRVVMDTIASPTYAPALAEKAIALATDRRAGLFHVGGGQPISWFQFASEIFAVCQLSADLIPTTRAEYPTQAERPMFSALSNAKLEDEGFGAMPGIREALTHYFDRREDSLREGNRAH
jgi:dTDP-4-dehydrorhamnose reductase